MNSTGCGAISGMRLGAMLRIRTARRLALEVFAEVLAVARASNVRPAPVGGTFAIEDIAITPEERRQRVGSLAGDHPVIELGVLDEIDALGARLVHAQSRQRERDGQSPHS